jgi:hypothetical protein
MHDSQRQTFGGGFEGEELGHAYENDLTIKAALSCNQVGLGRIGTIERDRAHPQNGVSFEGNCENSLFGADFQLLLSGNPHQCWSFALQL